MPVIHGFDFWNEFLKLSDRAQAKSAVVMLSSSSDHKDIDRTWQYPVGKKFLAKPLWEVMLQDLLSFLSSSMYGYQFSLFINYQNEFIESVNLYTVFLTSEFNRICINRFDV